LDRQKTDDAIEKFVAIDGVACIRAIAHKMLRNLCSGLYSVTDLHFLLLATSYVQLL